MRAICKNLSVYVLSFAMAEGLLVFNNLDVFAMSNICLMRSGEVLDEGQVTQAQWDDGSMAAHVWHMDDANKSKYSYDSTLDALVIDNVICTGDHPDGVMLDTATGILFKGECSLGEISFDEDIPGIKIYLDENSIARFAIREPWDNKVVADDGITVIKGETEGEYPNVTTEYTFSRRPIDIDTFKSKITATLDGFEYTGSAITPDIKIEGLTRDVDYTVEYANNINPGTATITIKGIGKYGGSITLEFKIAPKKYANDEVVDDTTHAHYKVTTLSDGTVQCIYQAPDDKKAKKIIVPETITLADGTQAKVTEIAPNAFKGSTAKEITIPKTVKKIGKNAFKDSSAKKIIIKTDKKAKVTIGKGAFKNMKNKNVTIIIKGCKGKAKKNLVSKIQKQSPKGTKVK